MTRQTLTSWLWFRSQLLATPSEIHLHTARFQFGANVVIRVLFYRLSFLIRQIIRKGCNYNRAQLETNPIRNEPNGNRARFSLNKRVLKSSHCDWHMKKLGSVVPRHVVSDQLVSFKRDVVRITCLHAVPRPRLPFTSTTTTTTTTSTTTTTNDNDNNNDIDKANDNHDTNKHTN